MIDYLQAPPESLEAEQSVLGCILQDANALSVAMEYLEPSDFYRDRHARIFSEMLRLSDRGIPPDVVTVTDTLRDTPDLDAIGGIVYFVELMDAVPHPGNIRYYSEIVRKMAVLRKAIEAGQNLSQAAFDGDPEAVANLLDVTNDRLQCLRPRPAEPDADLGEELLWMFHEGSTREKIETRGLTSGFPGLDKMTNGFEPSQSWILCARPGLGKTAMALSMIQHMCRRAHPVLFLSFEMSQRALLWRLLGMVTGIPNKVLTNEKWDPALSARIERVLDDMREWPLRVEYAPAMNLPQLRNRVRKAAEKGQAEIVFLDHVGLLDKGGHASRYDRTTIISDGIREMAGETEMPIVSLVQLSRFAERTGNRRPSLDLLRDTGAHEQNAHGVIGIYRDAYYSTDFVSSSEPHEAEVLILKCRDGETGIVKAEYWPNRTFFREPTVEEWSDRYAA